MKASLYFALIYRNHDVSGIDKSIINFLSGGMKYIKSQSIFLQSPIHDVEFDDLGKCLIDYCRSMEIPDFSNLKDGHIAYIQVVPETNDSPLRVYLDLEFIRMLSEKGIGIDIHAQ